MAKKLLGLEIFRGPSEINGENIVVIATGLNGKSDNPKTGAMVQVYILCDHQDPIEAVESGDDENICGNCAHRGKSCYVNVAQGPYAIYYAWKRNRYKKATKNDLAHFDGKLVRWGSYGDPAAVPFSIIKSINDVAKGFTSYTHQWLSCDQRLKKYCMASVDTYDEYKLATELGWRTFRTRSDTFELLGNEIQCPASNEGGHKTTCSKCLLCCGLTKTNKPSVAIVAHGSPPKVHMYKKLFPLTINQKELVDVTHHSYQDSTA